MATETEPGARDGEARLRRRRIRAWSWAAAVAVVTVVIVIVALATNNDSKTDSGSTPGTVATNTRVLVSLDDHGLHAAPAASQAGIIQFAFADRRTKPTGTETLLYYEAQRNVGGILVTGVGGSVRVLLCPHQWFLVARVDGTVKSRIAFAVSGTSSYCTTPVS